jgi:hypothetical protein
MQTRKRAKSVTFGKKIKDTGEKEHLKKTVEDEDISQVSQEASEKTGQTESKEIHEESQSELSATPPKTDEVEVNNAIVTPASEFASDNPLSSSPELPKDDKEQEATTEPGQLSATNTEVAQPIETPAHPTAVSEPQIEPVSPELSSTPPPSAFTIQTSEQSTQSASADVAEQPAKKHFGLYFIVVALLSFILGLGAMAGASYLGLVHVNFTKLPAGVQIPGLIGQKPTPTVLPPIAIPTVKPVDLTAFTITVLNGSGISGKAADAKNALNAAGFTVSSTGNADKSTYTKTEISAKKTVNHDYITKLEDELNKSYDVDTTVATSPDSDTTDVTVTLGSQTAQ